ncbi:MAG: carbohydrate ABC transporter permease [Caldilineaceae bacterium]|nr:carbohydrate ABC transporter permease [Caldilineaceae bacterium]
MIEKQTIGSAFLKWSLRIAITLFALLPMYAAIIIALTPSSDVMNRQLFPRYFEISNFATGFTTIGSGIRNSFFYSGASTILTLIISIPAAYVLARHHFRGKQIVLFGLLFTQMIAGIVLLPSLYTLFYNINAINSVAGVILVLTGVNLALVVWILYGYFQTLPVGIEEAAMLDGCGYLRMLVEIVLPISGPGVAVGAIFVFVNTYNEFVIPLFLLTDQAKYPLTLSLYSMLTDITLRWEIIAAASLIAIIPPTLIFLFFQKYIINGLTTGAVK